MTTSDKPVLQNRNSIKPKNGMFQAFTRTFNHHLRLEVNLCTPYKCSSSYIQMQKLPLGGITCHLKGIISAYYKGNVPTVIPATYCLPILMCLLDWKWGAMLLVIGRFLLNMKWHNQVLLRALGNIQVWAYMWCDQAKWGWIRKNKISVFFFNVCLNLRAIFCWKPHQNWIYKSRDISILVMLKTIKYRGY